MEHVYHVTNTGIPIGTTLLPDFLRNKGKVSVFFRALCQGPDVFCAALASAQYTDAMLDIPKGSPSAGKWATEGLFDFIRSIEYPNRPPRFNCIYVFNEIEQADQFIKEHRKNIDSGIYKCSIGSCVKFETDMNIFTDVTSRIAEAQVNINNSLQKQLKEISKMVKTYWQPPKIINIPEILLMGGPVTIVDRIK